MATTNTWAQVVEKISGVANRGAFSKTFTPTTSSQSASGAAGYYSSVSTTCNAVSLSGNAGTGQVLSGYTFYNNSLTRQNGAMANRGNLNWNPSSSTTYSVSAGYYSGGTLNSSGAYNAGVTAADNRTNTNSTNYKTGYNAGYSAGRNSKALKSASGSVTSYVAGANIRYVDIPLSGSPIALALYRTNKFWAGFNGTWFKDGSSASNPVVSQSSTKLVFNTATTNTSTFTYLYLYLT